MLSVAPTWVPKLWYGIGILHDRYGSLEHAEEAFSQVMQMQPDFEKANEIYFRLGIIYKQQGKYQESESIHRDVLERRQRTIGLETLQTLTSMGNLAVVLQDQFKYALTLWLPSKSDSISKKK